MKTKRFSAFLIFSCNILSKAKSNDAKTKFILCDTSKTDSSSWIIAQYYI